MKKTPSVVVVGAKTPHQTVVPTTSTANGVTKPPASNSQTNQSVSVFEFVRRQSYVGWPTNDKECATG